MKNSSMPMAGYVLSAVASFGIATVGTEALAADSSTGNAATMRKLQEQNQQLAKTMSDMQEQMLELKKQLLEMKQQTTAIDAKQVQQGQQTQQAVVEQQAIKNEVAIATQAAAQAVQTASVQSAKSSAWDKVSLWGYGEVYYTHPVHNSEQTTFDLRPG